MTIEFLMEGIIWPLLKRVCVWVSFNLVLKKIVSLHWYKYESRIGESFEEFLYQFFKKGTKKR